jgi:hypothetical protein
VIGLLSLDTYFASSKSGSSTLPHWKSMLAS